MTAVRVDDLKCGSCIPCALVPHVSLQPRRTSATEVVVTIKEGEDGNQCILKMVAVDCVGRNFKHRVHVRTFREVF